MSPGSLATNATLEDVRTACPDVDAMLLRIECDRLKAINADLLALAEALLSTRPGADYKQWIPPHRLAEMARAAIAKAKDSQ